MNVEKITIEELLKSNLDSLLLLQENLNEAIEKKRTSDKAEVIKKVNAIAQASGYTVSELFELSGKKNKKPAKIKYVNPGDSSLTWTGRGRKPTWLKDLLESGKKLEDFEIK
ncbi:MAG: H-NS histone family protein [Mycoplasmataceae bacterium]|nr:H-NS histone family protein [Mycoplasmataceae bacterium]